MRRLIYVSGFCLVLTATATAQTEIEERSSILYVTGRVAAATETTCLIDLGAVQTINDQDQLVLFRQVDNYFRPIGRVRVVELYATASDCIQNSGAQPGDIVMAVREISQLKPGARHRRRILQRHLVRSYLTTASSTFNNIRTANALSHYEKQFPEWERRRAEVAGVLYSERLLEREDERLERLHSQLNLMRHFYRQDARTVAAAGEPWEDALDLLAGRSAATDHLRRVEELQSSGDNSDEPAGLAADELRSRVFERVFHLQREQQNTVALIVASLMTDTALDHSIQMRTTIAQTQFPDLISDEQVLLDLGRLIQDLQALN